MGKPRQIHFIYIITFTVAMCSILYELAIAHIFSLLSANTVLRYSVTVGLYLAAMGIGAFLCNRLSANRQSWEFLCKVEIALSLLGGLAVAIVHFGHMIYSYLLLHAAKNVGITAFFLLVFTIIVAVGFFTGIELPLLINIANRTRERGKITNRILGIDYFGSLLGAVSFPLLLLPNLEVITISFITALLNLVVALSISFVFINKKRRYFLPAGAALALFSFFVIAIINVKDIQQYFLKKYYYYHESSKNIRTFFSPMHEFPRVERFSSPYQKIDIIKMCDTKGQIDSLLFAVYSTKFTADKDFPKDYALYLNGDPQIFSDNEEIYHEYFAHIPIILNETVPEKVLVLGGGDGLLNRELLKYPGIKKITHVDLDPYIVDLSRKHPVLRYLNEGSLDDPRVELIFADAYHYIQNTDQTYDAIYIDFPIASDYNLSKLYSREFYSFVKRRLGKNGYAVFDAPGTAFFTPPDREGKQRLDHDSEWPVYYHTLKSAGFETIIPYVTNLERDNPKAMEILRKAKIVVSEETTGRDIFTFTDKNLWEKETVIKQLIGIHVWALQQGFIMIKKEPDNIKFIYKNHGVKLHVLNEKRFRLAFVGGYAFSQRTDKDKVNSIMRPRLPNKNFLHIRLPN
ncbi:MAG: hypothetical protein ABH858_07225 [Candidatus Omnitrophota bacterium]